MIFTIHLFLSACMKQAAEKDIPVRKVPCNRPVPGRLSGIIPFLWGANREWTLTMHR